MPATLKPAIKAQYADELSQAEKMAQVGYDKNKIGAAKINEAVYGSTDPGSFSIASEMKTLQDENITDDSFLKAYEEQTQQMKQASPGMINNAFDAIQQDDPSFPVPQQQQQQQQQPVPVQQQADPTQMNFVAAEEPPVVQQFQQQQPQPQPQMQQQPTVAKQQDKEEEEVWPEDPVEQVNLVAKKLYKRFKNNAPSAQHLMQWKQMHGNVFLLEVGDRVFLYRYIKRVEWKQLLASEQFVNLDEDAQNEHIATRCTLWPRFTAESSGGKEAGIFEMLAQQIKMQSLFLDPVAVSSFTIKL
jgi:hypothetical protein